MEIANISEEQILHIMLAVIQELKSISRHFLAVNKDDARAADETYFQRILLA